MRVGHKTTYRISSYSFRGNYGTFLQQLECGYEFPALIHVWIASAGVLEYPHTHTRAVAGKSFPNVLTKRSIQYKYDDYSIIRLIFSHSDQCAIKISKKKIQKKIFEKKKKKFENCRKIHTCPRAGMDFPALYPFNLTNFWKILNLLGFSCTLMPK